MQLRKVAQKVAALSLGAGILTAGAVAIAPPATATTSVAGGTLTTFDSKLLSLINNVRASHGLRQLQVAAGTTDVAHGWSCHLATQQSLAHNGALLRELESHGSRYLNAYDENVGMSSTSSGAGWLFNAYMRSPEHRANILDPNGRYVGIWTKSNHGFRYNTIDFVGSRTTSYSASYGAMRTYC
jgi:uncharacterized protein YkwD